jgi:hypothetical protein
MQLRLGLQDKVVKVQTQLPLVSKQVFQIKVVIALPSVT